MFADRMIKNFVCDESQEMISVYDYKRFNHPMKYKARRNGLPVVLHISSVPKSIMGCSQDLAETSLCNGFNESELKNSGVDVTTIIDNIFIEQIGQSIVYRSRDCHQLLPNTGQICIPCSNLLELAKPDPCKQEEEFSNDEYQIEDYNGSDEKVVWEERKPAVISFQKIKDYCTEKLPNIKCTHCNEMFPTRAEQRKHMMQEHRDKLYVYECPEEGCDAYFINQKRSLANHVSKFHSKPLKKKEKKPRFVYDFKCLFCDRMFIKGSMKIEFHLTYDHGDLKGTEEYENFLVKFRTCKYCGKACSSRLALNKHEVDQHPEKAVIVSCHLCGKGFRSKASMRKHLHDEHGEDKKLMCTYCAKSFPTNSRLRKHIAYHENNSAQCNECGGIFKTKTILKSHKASVHENLKSFKCETCGKGFNELMNLNQHINTQHKGLKPYICEACGYSSGNYSNLNLHRKKNHQLPYQTKKELQRLIEDGNHPFCEKLPVAFLTLSFEIK